MIDFARGLAALAIAALVAVSAVSCSTERTVILATGTTPYDSGLLDALTPLFQKATGYDLKVIPVGTGQALEMGRRGDADVILAHSPEAEQQFLDDGYGADRRFVMYNDFVIVGPPDDPAGVSTASDAVAAMGAIASSGSAFVSRADDSGTNVRELSLWDALGVSPTREGWYIEAGQGMGATLQVASQRRAYVLSDRGTFLALRDTLDLDILFENDPLLINLYHVMEVNSETVDGVNASGARAFVDFMVSSETQDVIAQFGKSEYGQPLFHPAAGKSENDVLGVKQED